MKKILEKVKQFLSLTSENKINIFIKNFPEELLLQKPYHFGKGTCFEIEKKSLLQFNANVYFKNHCNLLVRNGAELRIGTNCFFNNYCSINCLLEIEIGDNSIFGEGVKIYDHNHKHFWEGGNQVISRNDFKLGKISIGHNCWIGSNVTILRNVTIGNNVIIGANCLIHKSIPANSIVKAGGELTINSFDS